MAVWTPPILSIAKSRLVGQNSVCSQSKCWFDDFYNVTRSAVTFSMCPQLSDYVAVKDIPDAGRGVVTTRPIEADTLVHVGEEPAAHVVFREYRKEVCASCFFYDRGRTLPVRENAIGKVYCSEACRSQWLQNHGTVGLAAWRAVETFLQAKNKLNKALPDESSTKLSPDEIDTAWNRAEKAQRLSLELAKSKQNGRKKAHIPWPMTDPDVLSFLLSGILFHHQQRDRWQGELLALAMDDQPYRDLVELETHCIAYQQLFNILPTELLVSVTPIVCRTVYSAAGHNAFGIRAGSDDNEEYMGYAIYPSASYFNHSCRPNISKKRVGRSWEFRALESMPVVGEECCITYLGGDEKDMTVDQRRARLEETWGFECRCKRCNEEAMT